MIKTHRLMSLLVATLTSNSIGIDRLFAQDVNKMTEVANNSITINEQNTDFVKLTQVFGFNSIAKAKNEKMVASNLVAQTQTYPGVNLPAANKSPNLSYYVRLNTCQLDIQLNDWVFQALQSLVERYICIFQINGKGL